MLIVKDPSEITKETQGSRNTVLSGNSSIDRPKTPDSNAREKKSTSDGKKSRSGILSRHWLDLPSGQHAGSWFHHQ